MIKRTFLSMLMLVLCAILACFCMVTVILFHNFDNMYDVNLDNEVKYISRGIELNGMDFLTGLNTNNCRVTWVNADGSVIYDSAVEATQMENHGMREEIQEAFLSGEGDSVRYSDTMDKKTSNKAVRIADGTVVRVSSSSDTLLHIFARLMRPLLIVFLGTMAVAVYIAFKTSRKIVEPLENLDLEHPENVKTYEELTPFLKRIEQQNKQIRAQMRELKQQQTEFAEITENMSEGFLVIDTQQRVLSYNSSALRLLRVPEDIETKNVVQICRSESIQDAIEIALEGTHNEQLMKEDGRIYSILANPVFRDEAVTGVIIVIMDVTEKEQRNSLRREFTANVSHELKTPLTSISGTAEIMKNGLIRLEDIPRFSDIIYKEAQRMINLVGDILKLSKLEETGQMMEKEDVDLSCLIESVVESLQSAAEKKRVSFVTDIQPGCTIQGIGNIVDEIVFNLCDNAIKYNKEGGTVAVSLEKQENAVCLAVKDTGIGISYQDQQRVFERFYRVDKSHSKEIGGTGLGLSIVKHGVITLGGDILLESKEGIGTKITVRFPM